MAKPIITLLGLTIVQRTNDLIHFDRILPTSGVTLLDPIGHSNICDYAQATTHAGKFEWDISGPFTLDEIKANFGSTLDYTIYIVNSLGDSEILYTNSGQYISEKPDKILPSSSWIEIETQNEAAPAAKWVSVRVHKTN